MRIRAGAAFTAFCLLTPADLWACSPAPGVDVAAFYAAIERPPYVLGGLSVAAAAVWLLIAGRRSPSRRWAIVLVALAVFQPAWWLRNTGDCGMFRDTAALAVTVVSLVILVAGLLRVRRSAIRAEHQGAGV